MECKSECRFAGGRSCRAHMIGTGWPISCMFRGSNRVQAYLR